MLITLALILLARANGFAVPPACWIILALAVICAALRFCFYTIIIEALKKVIR